MITPLPSETLAWLRHAASCGKAEAQTLLHLLERMDALEKRPIPGTVELATPIPEAAPVAANDSELKEELFELYEKHDIVEGALLSIYDLGVRRCMNTLGRQHGAAQPPTPQPAPAAPAEALAARPLMEQVAAMSSCIGAQTVGEIMAISGRAAAWLRDNPPGQPVAVEPRGCPAPGACSCVEPAPPAAPAPELVERVAKAIGDAAYDDLPTAELNRIDARAAIREMAAWIRETYDPRKFYGAGWAKLMSLIEAIDDGDDE